MSAVWVYGTGSCVTAPVGIYHVAHPFGDDFRRDAEVYEYSEKNGYRMSPYHRLDLSISFIKQQKWGERRWIVGFFNAYNRSNPFFVDIEQKYHPEGIQYKYVQYSLFPIIPSVSYQFKF
jgi:hypothetical protein